MKTLQVDTRPINHAHDFPFIFESAPQESCCRKCHRHPARNQEPCEPLPCACTPEMLQWDEVIGGYIHSAHCPEAGNILWPVSQDVEGTK